MEQTKARVEHVDKRPPGLCRRLRVTTAHPLLGDLNVPVCILVPQKCVDSLASGAEVVGLELPGHGGDQPVATRDHPALGEGKGRNLLLAHRPTHSECSTLVGRQVVQAHHEEARRVPQLVGKVAVALDLLHRERYVLTRRHAGDERQTECIGAVQRDGLQRVDDVALRLRHLLALPVTHEAVHVDRVKRGLAREFDAKHHHPSDPEEEDIVPGLHDRRRVVPLEIALRLWRLRGPADGGEWPQPRGEPGVQDVFVLAQRHARTKLGLRRLARRRLVPRDVKLVGAVRVPDRDAVPPPQLPRHAPVLDVLEPVEIDLLETLRQDFDLPSAHGVEPLLSHPVHLDKPLSRDHRLDDLAGALRAWDALRVFLDFDREPLSLHVGP
mmetsp:Transcript_23386/g.39949  ORF Transcript_23386/g.39949 Transcript_23386/m.39949 type:complete len:383 (-) Transcript_23386:1299-2447(-)